MKTIQAVIRDRLEAKVVIGVEVLGKIGELVRDYIAPSKTLVIVDKAVPRRFVEAVEESLKESKLDYALRLVEGGEKTKTLEFIQDMWKTMLEEEMHRDGVVVCLGGGSLLDAVGFAAATYMRGLSWVSVPTTLLAMADAAIGGKTAINYNGFKNVIGVFHHPKLVVVDLSLVESLSHEDYLSGLAEIAKHALIRGGEFYNWLRNHAEKLVGRDLDALVRAVEESIRVKLNIVSRDYRETTGLRMVLNLGHTVAHALESVTNYGLRHGQAVAIGINIESTLAASIVGLRMNTLHEIRSLIESLELPLCPPKNLDVDKTLQAVVADKKRRRGGRIVLPLLRDIGVVVLQSIPLDEAIRGLKESWLRACSQ